MSESHAGLFGVVGVTAAMTLFSPTVLVAADYLSVDAAQRSIFPDADLFVPALPVLSAQQKAAIAAQAGTQPAHGTLTIWQAMQGPARLGYVFIDEVIGRSDLITYAVGIHTDGTLSAIEILSYRESHGGEIRNAKWRAQFDGRRGLDSLNFRTDIKNISGATLSSEHVTQGVRWLVALWETALSPS